MGDFSWPETFEEREAFLQLASGTEEERELLFSVLQVYTCQQKFTAGNKYAVLEAVAYCVEFTKQAREEERLPKGYEYRLPTEAEWEYACRSGGKDQKYCGGNNLDQLGWYGDNSNGKTHPVGQKKANGLGLYDMNGNVWEWVQDWYGPYSSNHSTPSSSPASGSNRVLRGGSWNSNDSVSRSAYRRSYSPFNSYGNMGFRLAR